MRLSAAIRARRPDWSVDVRTCGLVGGIYDPAMWKRVRERLLSGVAILLLVAWLACAVGIAMWVAQVTGIDVGRKGAVGLLVVIYLVPIGAVVAVDEFVVRRIRYGPPLPGRRKRGALDPDQLRDLDQRLKRRTGDTSEG